MAPLRLLSLLVVAAVAFAPVACSDDDAPASSGPSATVKIIPGSVDFGTLRVGQNATAAMILMNDSGTPITITSADMETGSDFTVVGFPYSGEVLLPGIGVNFKVLFSPDGAVPYSDRVVITYNATKSVSAAVKGVGALPDLSADMISTAGTSFATFDPIPVAYRFSEIAGVESGAFSVAVVLSTDLSFDPTVDIVLAGKFRLSMEANEVDSGEITDGIIPQAPPADSGAYFIGLVVDWTEGAAELSETNNIAWTASTIDVTFFEFRYTGTVTDGVTSDPIEGANVSADGISATTDANGWYDFRVSSPGPYDVSAGASGYIGSRALAVTASALTDFQLVAPENIAVMQSSYSPMQVRALWAVQEMFPDANIYTTTSALSFGTTLNNGTNWDLAVYDEPAYFGNNTAYNNMGTYVNDGGRFIWSGWDQRNFSSASLWSALGIGFGGISATIRPYVPYDPNHPIATQPNEWPTGNTSGWTDYYGVNGYINTVQTGGYALAGTTSDPTSPLMLTFGNDGKTLVLGECLDCARSTDNDGDGKKDGQEMWENFITYVLGR